MSKSNKHRKQRSSVSPDAKKSTQPQVASTFVTSLLGRLFAFNLFSAILQILALLYMVSHVEVAIRIWDEIPPYIRAPLFALFAAAVGFRLHLNRKDNPRLGSIVLSDKETKSYAIRQASSTLITMLFTTALLLFMSGVLERPAKWIVGYYASLDEKTIAAILAVVTSIFWNVVSSAIWDFIKQAYQHAKSKENKKN